MPYLFVYLIKVNIVLVLFYLAYRFLLRPLTFYVLNRFFLVFGILFSATYPFVNFSALFVKNPELSSKLVTVIPDWQESAGRIDVLATAQSSETFNYWLIPEAIFWLGVLVLSIRLIVQLLSMYRLHRQSVEQRSGNYSYRHVEDKINPFSFMRNIYLNATSLNPAELRSVLEHEQVHVKEWHSLDVLLSELNVIFYWFNPGAWLMKKAVKENLEFIADFRILQQGADFIAYQYDLLHIATMKQSSPLVNHFSLLTIKRRIMMMNRGKSSRLQLAKYLLLTPLVIVISMAFTVTKEQFARNKSSVHSIRQNSPSQHVSTGNEMIAERTRNINGRAFFTKEINPSKSNLSAPAAVQWFFEKYTTILMHRAASRPDTTPTTTSLTGLGAEILALEKRVQLFERRNDTILIPKEAPFFKRIVVRDKEGKILHDSVAIECRGARGSGKLGHNAKVGFIIDGEFYTEEQVKQFDIDKIRKIQSGGRIWIGDGGGMNGRPYLDKYYQIDGIDLSSYGVMMGTNPDDFVYDKNLEKKILKQQQKSPN